MLAYAVEDAALAHLAFRLSVSVWLFRALRQKGGVVLSVSNCKKTYYRGLFDDAPFRMDGESHLPAGRWERIKNPRRPGMMMATS